jgi:predicted nucleic acid binding AN1-type Zn finger protein
MLTNLKCKFCSSSGESQTDPKNQKNQQQPRYFCSIHRLPEDHACQGLPAMVKGLRTKLKIQLDAGADIPSDQKHHWTPIS